MFHLLTKVGSGLFTIWSSLVESLRVWSVILNYSWSFSVNLRNFFSLPPPGTFIGLLLNLFKNLIFYL